MPSLFNSFKITMLSYAYMLTDIVTKSFHDLKLQRDMDILQESCEYTNSHNCHIGMASLRHELQVSVLRKTMRFHSFMFLMCFNINMKAAINSHKLMVGHNLHSNHFVKTAIVKIVTLQWLLSVMSCQNVDECTSG